MPPPLVLDLSHTSHTRARTGVQRVSRALYEALGSQCESVCYDPYQGLWRPLEDWEKENLESADPARGRGSQWPLGAKIRGSLRKARRESPLLRLPELNGAGPTGVLVPEIFSSEVGKALSTLFAAAPGPRVALFHDAVALQYPEFSPRSTVARFPAYLRELLQFDGVAAVSETSRDSLLDYWRWLGVAHPPPVVAVTLGIEASPAQSELLQSSGTPIVLCVSSIEGRKNHASLLDACEQLWASGSSFQLRLVGIVNRETGGPALERIERLRAAGRPLRYEGPLKDEALERAYAECSFTVYPTLAEGFGLPVAESLSRGKPCLCRMTGATGEIGRLGGCLGIGAASPSEIATAMAGLLGTPGELERLQVAARGRRFKTWAQYAAELLDWMASIRRLQ